MKQKKWKKKRKHYQPGKKPLLGRKAALDAYIDSWINLFIEISTDQILEGLLTNEDGEYSMFIYIPGVPGEIEVKFNLEDFLREWNRDTNGPLLSA